MKNDRMTDIKVYRETLEPGKPYVMVEWLNIDGDKKYKCFSEHEEDQAKAFACKLRDFKPFYKELEF